MSAETTESQIFDGETAISIPESSSIDFANVQKGSSMQISGEKISEANLFIKEDVGETSLNINGQEYIVEGGTQIKVSGEGNIIDIIPPEGKSVTVGRGADAMTISSLQEGFSFSIQTDGEGNQIITSDKPFKIGEDEYFFRNVNAGKDMSVTFEGGKPVEISNSRVDIKSDSGNYFFESSGKAKISTGVFVDVDAENYAYFSFGETINVKGNVVAGVYGKGNNYFSNTDGYFSLASSSGNRITANVEDYITENSVTIDGVGTVVNGYWEMDFDNGEISVPAKMEGSGLGGIKMDLYAQDEFDETNNLFVRVEPEGLGFGGLKLWRDPSPAEAEDEIEYTAEIKDSTPITTAIGKAKKIIDEAKKRVGYDEDELSYEMIDDVNKGLLKPRTYN